MNKQLPSIKCIVFICLDNMGLDKFLSNTTSEDNQSFDEIIKEAEIQFQKKVIIEHLIITILKHYLKSFIFF